MKGDSKVKKLMPIALVALLAAVGCRDVQHGRHTGMLTDLQR